MINSFDTKIFEENNCITFKVEHKSMIYFFFFFNVVVYVGQTKQGILRPLSHKDKKYDTIKILYCDEKELNRLEDRYITKYRPKYNKTLNCASRYSLMRARNKIRQEINNYEFTMWDLKKIIKKLNIELCSFNFKYYIKQEDYEKIVDFIKGAL